MSAFASQHDRRDTRPARGRGGTRFWNPNWWAYAPDNFTRDSVAGATRCGCSSAPSTREWRVSGAGSLTTLVGAGLKLGASVVLSGAWPDRVRVDAVPRVQSRCRGPACACRRGLCAESSQQCRSAGAPDVPPRLLALPWLAVGSCHCTPRLSVGHVALTLSLAGSTAVPDATPTVESRSITAFRPCHEGALVLSDGHLTSRGVRRLSSGI